MARPEAIQIAGYFPTPLAVLDPICSLISPSSYFSIVDPCAGEGEAVNYLRDQWKSLQPRVYTVEMEKTRAAKLTHDKDWRDQVAHGDFFHLHYVKDKGASIMWLNPPYDTDPVHGRLEERFLQRATTLMTKGGTLVFLVPHYALKASAITLATFYEDIRCFRFPGKEWEGYKQVALLATRRGDAVDSEEIFVDKQTVALIETWATDPTSIPTLGITAEARYFPPESTGFSSWKIVGLDLRELSTTYQPWESEAGPLTDISPPNQALEMFHRTYPVASRPRAVHLASALSAGIFNGVEVTPDDPTNRLPNLLVKGVFDKEFRGVEDKYNKKGEKVAELQVQQPKLTVTVLDLSTGQYHTVKNDVTANGPRVDDMSMRDLLNYYGKSLMGGMLEACPVLHDPSNDPNPIPMPELGRPLYPAQVESVRTILKLQNTYPEQGIIILGEIGSGKTSISLAAAKSMGRKKILVVCPPHLLSGWEEQINIVLPEAEVHILETVQDVENFAKGEKAEPLGFLFEKPESPVRIGLLTRERAKLGHGWIGVTGCCPKCGGPLPTKDLAKSRARCECSTLHPTNMWAEWLIKALPHLIPHTPKHRSMGALQGKFLQKRIENWKSRKAPEKLSTEAIQCILDLIPMLKGDSRDLRVWLAWLLPDQAATLAQFDSNGWDKATIQEDILLAADPQMVEETVQLLRTQEDNSWGQHSWSRWFENSYKAYRDNPGHMEYRYPKVEMRNGLMYRNNIPLGSPQALGKILDEVLSRSSFTRTNCGEFLYQAQKPYRYPLASWIQRRNQNCYDMLILDECQEFSARGSAQTAAAQRLMLSRVPTLLLTGSLLNGYAESIYMNMYGISPRFRQTFGRNNVARFIDRYGYWKRVVEEKDYEGKVIAFGSQSDRVIRSARKAGVAPGILPLFQLDHILRQAVTLQKEDLALGIPPRSEERVDITAEGDLLDNYNLLLDALKKEIKETRFIPGMAGKLWGAMARLPSYLDLAAVGNTDNGYFEIRWPENTPERAGQLIASASLMDPSQLLPKEKILLKRIQEEVAEGRNVMVMCWHTRLVQRMTEVIGNAGFRVIHLDPNKVGTKIRQTWIDKNVVKKNIQVLVCNPIVIQTGLNNLVHFATQIWVENPLCNAIVYRQATGRIDRIGQTLPSRIAITVYQNTAQEHQHQLLMHKVGVSETVDGLDPEGALRAAGVIDDDYMGFEVGKQLYKMLTDET